MEVSDTSAVEALHRIGKKLRKRILDLITQAKTSHIGACFSLVEIFTHLYYRQLNLASIKSASIDRDYCILSKGHATVAWYAVLESVGLLPPEICSTYGTDGTILTGHCVRNVAYGLEASTGSLGHGLSIGVGVALGLKQKKSSGNVYVILGDGETQEGSVWEACMAASVHKLSNLWIIVDKNNLQGLADRPQDLGSANLYEKFSAFGLSVCDVDGHDYTLLNNAFCSVASDERPKVIIAKTIKGKGVSFMQDSLAWHYKCPNQEQYEQALRELE